MNEKKQLWEDYGANEAYYAVVTLDKFRKDNLGETAKEEFFQMGRDHVTRIFREIEDGFAMKFAPRRALDYGCGVGRILVALAEKCEQVVGVDISHAMLDETRKNCKQRDITNVELQDASEFIGAASESYDFVHSFIVLQHIDPKIGNELIRTMTKRLSAGGIGMLHATFFDPLPLSARLRFRIYRDVPFVHRILNTVRGKKDALIPLYEYDLNRVFQMLHANGCGECFVRFSDHGSLGAMIFFRKGETEVY